MSGRFRRVSDTQQIPETVERAFYGEREDPYKELRAGATERRVKIASQTMDMRRETPVREQSWAVERGQETYIDRMMRPADERLSNLSPADVSTNAVRRLGSSYDNGYNTRSAGQELYVTTEDALSLLRRGVSLWNPNMDEVDYTLRQAMEEHDAQFENENTREFKARKRKEEWERRNAASLLRQRREVTARGHQIVRTSQNNEYVTETQWGIPNYSPIIEAERERMLAYERAKEERLAFKRKGYDPATRRLSWEEHAQRAIQASRFQDHQAGWMDNFTSDYRGR